MATKCPYCGSADVTVNAHDVTCLQCKKNKPELKGKP